MALAWAVDGDGNYRGGEHAPPTLRALGTDEATGEVAQPVDLSPTDALSILIVDDEESLRQTLSAILETAGHRVVGAADGQIALQLLQEQEFDVLVLDLHMPKANGVTLLGWIQVPPPVVIVYSAFAYFSLDAVRRDLGAKVFRFLQKPASPLELIAAVNEAAGELDR